MLGILAAGATCLAISIYALTRSAYATSLLFFAPVTLGVFWVLAVEIETKCGVITKTTRLPCQHTTYGLLFGCSSPHHHLGKFLTRIGLQKKKPVPTLPTKPRTSLRNVATAHMGDGPTNGPSGAILVRVEEDAKSKVGYWLMVAASAASVLSAALGVVTLR
jgi:hypothetical protein